MTGVTIMQGSTVVYIMCSVIDYNNVVNIQV